MSKAKQGMLTMHSALFWILFWIAAVVAIAFPDSTTEIANAVGIGRGTDLVLYISLIVIFYLLFRLQIKLEKINRDITTVVRNNAVRDSNEV